MSSSKAYDPKMGQFRWIFLLAATLFLAAASVRSAELALVLSDNGGVYSDFASQFENSLEGSHWQIRWRGNANSLDSLPKVDLIVAVGSEATRNALKRPERTPILATLLPRNSYEKLLSEASTRPRGGVSAVLLDQPPLRLLAFARQLLPDKKRIALITSPETQALLPQIKQAAARLGQSLDIEELDADVGPVPALNRLMPHNDLLLALPDSRVFNRENVRPILVTTFRHQKPVIAFSSAYVSAGALASLFASPGQIARQCVDFIKPLRNDTATLPPAQNAALFTTAINRTVAKSLGIDLPDDAVIQNYLSSFDREARQ